MSKKEKCLGVLRLRGRVNIHPELEYTFKLMHLTRKNHLTLIRGTPSNLGAIQKIKDYTTWGEVSPEIIIQLLQKRGRLKGNQRLTNDNIKEKLGYDSVEELALDIYAGKVDLWKTPYIKPLFRLNSPKGGFHGTIKNPLPKGELGYRGDKINDLINKMI
ncbi:MAG: 50S ribosomal protein L30 [Candidatus Ranarchaeia archaeon]